MKHRGLVGIGVCACLALGTFGCGKSDKKPAADPAPATTTPETTPPSTNPPAPAAARGLAGLFSKKSSSKEAKPASPLSGMFGGGINVGAGPGMTAAAADEDMPTAPTPQAKAPAPAPAGPTSAGCTKVAAHVAAMIQKEMGADIPASTLDDMKVELARKCTSDAWPDAAVTCVLAAGDISGLSACESQIPGADHDGDMADDMDHDMDLDDADFGMPDMGPSTPVPSGDAKCDKVAAHAWNLLVNDPTMVPADQRAAMEGMKVQMINMIAAECVNQKFTEAVKDCILGAKKITDTEGCGI